MGTLVRFATGVGILTWMGVTSTKFVGTARGSERFGYIHAWVVDGQGYVGCFVNVSFLVSSLVVLSPLCSFMVSLPFFSMVVGLILIQITPTRSTYSSYLFTLLSLPSISAS
jgi:hypothetical protein